MEILKLKNYTRGWVVGDFDPTVIKTKDFEVGVKEYIKGDKESAHVHKIAEEISIVVTGKFVMNDAVLSAGDIVRLAPKDVADFSCLESGSTVVIKVPSVKGDKYLV